MASRVYRQILHFGEAYRVRMKAYRKRTPGQ
jgi:hypothetical protein